MKLLELIVLGMYTMGKEPPAYNNFGRMHEGATIYRFENGIDLRTHTGDSWFLYVDQSLVSLREANLTDTLINEAFARAKQTKLAGIK